MNQIRIIIILFFIPSIIFSNDDIENIIKVADSFYNDMKFELAIIEYQRANVIYPKNEYYIQNQVQIANCYRNMGYFIESINIHKTILEKTPNHWNSIFEVPFTYQLMNNFSESNRFIRNHFKYVVNGKKDSLIFLKSCNYFALMDVDSSKLFFNTINDLNLQNLIDRNLKVISEFESIKHFDYKKAKYLNMLFPGAGYLYLDMDQTFVSTLIVESLFLYATIVTKKNQYAIGTLFGGLFFSGFYLGSIYGAEQFAKKKMKNLYKRYFDKLIFDYHY